MGLFQKIMDCFIRLITFSLLLSGFIQGLFVSFTFASPKHFNTTYQQEALLQNELPSVHKDHPRLLLRPQAWTHGPDVQSLKKKAAGGVLEKFALAKPWNPKPGNEWAFRYILTGDEQYAKAIIEKIKAPDFYWPGKLTELSILYDWIYKSPSFKDADKRVVEDKIISWSHRAIIMGQKRSTIWNHMGYSPFLDIAAAGLAIAGHRKEGTRLMALAGGYAKKNLFPAWQANDGAWQGGWAYYSQGCAKLFQFIAMWSSATDENLYVSIRKEQGDWVRNHLYYLVYTFFPDQSPADTAGFSFTPDQAGAYFTLLQLTFAFKDSFGLENVKRRQKGGWRYGIWPYLYEASDRFSKKDRAALPLSKLWGKNGVGYTQFRSGWDKNATIIEFKCGDYYWSHQFQNQNSFTIYRRGRLAIQSGIYDSYFGKHMQSYYRPSVSSNTVLLIQPGETRWLPENLADRFHVPNKNGYFDAWGGQRNCYIVPDYGSAETCFTWDNYLWRKSHEHHFETGDIRNYETADAYTYVSGDATNAYNNREFTVAGNRPKMGRFLRRMLFVDRKYLIISDLVKSLDSRYLKKWLLHSIEEPLIESLPLKTAVKNHRETYEAGVVKIKAGDGQLFCQTLFAGDFRVEKIGGKAEISRILTGSSNQGNAALSGFLEPRYHRISDTIATDKALEESWLIQFLDNEQFAVQGSVTGKDGVGSIKKRYFLSGSQSLLIPANNWSGIPVKGDIFRFDVIAHSHRFWVNDRNYAPSIKKMLTIFKDGSRIQPGGWRVEVYPKKQQEMDDFLHFLYPCDSNTKDFPKVSSLQDSGGLMKGLVVEGWAVLFPRGKVKAPEKFSYSLSKKKEISHIVAGMKPGALYEVLHSSQSGQEKKRVKRVEEASAGGILFFSTKGVQRIEIRSL